MKPVNQFDLGRFVRARERRDGTHHVFMSVPASLRPSGWPKTITLPEEGSTIGSLHDEKFRARVLKAAACVNKRLDARRDLEKTYKSEGRKNTRALAEIYFRTLRYRKLSDARKYRNRRDAMIVVRWAEGRGDPDFAGLLKADFEDLLAIYDDRPSAQLDIRSILNVLCKEAIPAGFRTDNPVEDIPWTAPEPKEKVVLWKQNTVDRYAAMARQMGQPGLAALIEVGMVVGQRLGDLRTARHQVNYLGGRFRMVQSKTKVKVNFPLNARVRKIIESVRLDGSPYLFNDSDTGTAFTAANLAARFAEVRHALTEDGGPKMVLRSLRHSAVCAMFDEDVELINIVKVTGHRMGRANRIIMRYAIDDEALAEKAMRIMNRAEGGSDADFEGVAFGADQDWEGGSQPIYRRPEFDEDRPMKFLGASDGKHRHHYDTTPMKLWPE
jgi:hypothetical protein